MIGLTPIEPKMLEMQVKNYLKCEMKVRPSIVEQLDIVKVFHHAKDDWNTLYVEFGSELEVDILYSYTKNIKKNDHRVFPYIPKQMYRRYRGAESFLYTLRQEEKVKTKVKIGKDDLFLATKLPGSSYWRKIPLPNNLPQMDFETTENIPYYRS